MADLFETKRRKTHQFGLSEHVWCAIASHAAGEKLAPLAYALHLPEKLGAKADDILEDIAAVGPAILQIAAKGKARREPEQTQVRYSLLSADGHFAT